MEDVLNWCASVVGSFEVVSDHSRSHAGRRAAASRLHTSSGYCYLKMHRDQADWDSEVHAYEQWATAFGDFAPHLIGVRDEKPLALVVSELPGRILEEVRLTAFQECAIWRAAGQALVKLHGLAVGEYFGPCRRDGTPVGKPIYEAKEYVTACLEDIARRGSRSGYLNGAELAIVRDVRALVRAFEGERPVPCHRDYCPANWLVTGDSTWAGVIDFEFAHWDVRVADFTRYPDWNWIGRPDLVAAFFDGYGRSMTPQEEQQRLVAHAHYALTAIVWGSENSYYGFADEGRRAVRHLGQLLG